MTSTFRRIVLTTAAILLLGLAAVALVEAGIAIGAGGVGADPALIGAVSAASSDAAFAGEIDALLAADQSAAPSAAAAGRAKVAVAGLRRLAAARHLVHATVVVDLPRRGGLTTIQLDHGTISAVSATSLTIKEAGDASATVVLGDETRVRKHAAKAAIGDLKVGDEVFVMSRVEASGTDAYLVVVPAI
jgi:hypothetical protein